jgi:hypothetical protein
MLEAQLLEFLSGRATRELLLAEEEGGYIVTTHRYGGKTKTEKRRKRPKEDSAPLRQMLRMVTQSCPERPLQMIPRKKRKCPALY